MDQSIFDIMTAKQIAELYIIFLGATALLVAVSALIFTILSQNKTEKK